MRVVVFRVRCAAQRVSSLTFQVVTVCSKADRIFGCCCTACASFTRFSVVCLFGSWQHYIQFGEEVRTLQVLLLGWQSCGQDRHDTPFALPQPFRFCVQLAELRPGQARHIVQTHDFVSVFMKSVWWSCKLWQFTACVFGARLMLVRALLCFACVTCARQCIQSECDS